MKPTLTQILIAVAVIIFLYFHNLIWMYIKRLFFKPDVKKLMEIRDKNGLLKALSYKKDRVDFDLIRTNAAIALGNIGDTSAIDKLVEALKDIDRNVVKASIQAIGQITLRCVRQPMFTAFQNRNQAQIQSLLSTLQQIQLKATSQVKYAYDSASELQLVISTLGIISGSEAVDFLLDLVNRSDSESIRKIALQGLISTGDPKLPDILLKLLNNKDPQLRVASAEMIGKIKDKRAVGPLVKMLSAAHVLVRKSAAEALGRMREIKSAEKILTMLSDEHPECRKTAAEALANLGDQRWTQLVKGDDQDFNRIAGSGEPQAFEILINAPDKEKIVPALGKLGDKRAVEPLLTMLEDQDDKIRKNAARALGEIGEKKAVDPLIVLIADKNPHVRKAVAQALEKLGESDWVKWVKGEKSDLNRIAQSRDPRAFDILIKMENNEEAILALGVMRDKRAVEPLIKKLENTDRNIRAAALKSLGTIGDKQVIEPIKRLLVDEDGNIRKKAALALEKLGESKWLEYINGAPSDFNVLLHAGDGYIVTESIKVVMDRLYSSSYSDRKEAAEVLIRLAAIPPTELKNFWTEIRERINTRHTDSHEDRNLNRSSDCTHNDSHSDSGIGLSFPPMTEQFKN